MGIILPLHCRSIICCASAVYIFIIWASSSVGLSHPGLFFFGIKIGSPSSNVDLRDHYPFASRRCRSSSRSRASGYTAKFKTKLVGCFDFLSASRALMRRATHPNHRLHFHSSGRGFIDVSPVCHFTQLRASVAGSRIPVLVGITFSGITTYIPRAVKQCSR
jgi:hypothetical protein